MRSIEELAALLTSSQYSHKTLADGSGVVLDMAGMRVLSLNRTGMFVVDEIAGQLVALMFIPLTGPTVIAAFLLFRLFDIWKPYPVRRLEELPGASGIMADDLLAGTYANLVLQALIRIFPHGWNLT